MYDIIGDIHGYSNKLDSLLVLMGYKKKDGVYSHNSRKAIFVGDFIDRGPNVRETLEIIKNMYDSGNALAVIGNHEYNAICYHTKDSSGCYLRSHNQSNMLQLKSTLDAFSNYPDEWKSYINWFMKLPLYIDLDGFRVVHACWDNKQINFIKNKLPNNCLNYEVLYKSTKKNTVEYEAINVLLKGKEINLPKGHFFNDEEGLQRDSVRIKWWLSGYEFYYNDIAMNNINLQDMSVPKDLLGNQQPYYSNQPPVFFGHYWLSGSPKLMKPNVCCLDYSVAKGGKLAAYRFDKEQILDKNKIIVV